MILPIETKKRIIKDLKISYQEEDYRVAFANPSDAARVFIKGNNWYGTVVEALIDLSVSRIKLHSDIRILRGLIHNTEQLVLETIESIPTAATKNKDVYEDWITTKATSDQRGFLKEQRHNLGQLESQLDALVLEESQLNLLLKHIDGACERATQYVNWCKYESRENEPRR